MDATYSPRSPDVTGTNFTSPKSQQLRKQSLSRQTFLSGSSPTTTHLADGLEQQFTYNYNSNPYVTNLNPSPAKLDSAGTELLNESRLASFHHPEYLQSEPLNFSSAAHRHLHRPIVPTHNPIRTDIRANPQAPSYYNYHNFSVVGPESITNMSETWAPTSVTNKPPTPTSHFRAPMKKAEHKPPSNSNPIPQYADPNPRKIEIKTKFPVARIKRIMQADEEVGKVAQVTPVAVSKALELFMIALVTGAADKARDKGSKKVNAQHLRMVVESQPERFDFLAEIVGKVADAGDGATGENTKAGRRRKEESESTSDEEREKDKGKKKGKGRKKKIGD